jgi:hypothetical protein
MNVLQLGLVVALIATTSQQPVKPTCTAEPNRRAEGITGTVRQGERFDHTTPSGWILRLGPVDYGWFLEVTMKGREAEDLSRLTPPWHFVPNPRDIEGWHLRNADNVGPNDGSTNAPAELRNFIFSPRVGRDLDYHGSATRSEDVELVRSYGRGWLYMDSVRLTPIERGGKASFESLTFSVCLTWPAGPTRYRVVFPEDKAPQLLAAKWAG